MPQPPHHRTAAAPLTTTHAELEQALEILDRALTAATRAVAAA
ncbi:hypothetical protein [Streptomyces sp. MST-110588]|nr:hypothetical protein [Streptomyces sp. MST-110588]